MGTYPAGGLEQEVVICPPVAEPEVAVCPPMEVEGTITTYPAVGLEQEVVITKPEAMEVEDDADAFDFFSPEPIGSRARDLEREQEEAAAAAAAAAAASASSQVTSVSSSSETTTVADGSTWITETSSMIITTTTTTTTVVQEDGQIVEKQEVTVSQSGGDIETTSTSEVVDAGVAAVTESVAVTEAATVSAAATSGVEAVGAAAQLVNPLAMFYTEEVRSTADAPGEVVQEGFRVVDPSGRPVPDDVLDEAGHPEKQ